MDTRKKEYDMIIKLGDELSEALVTHAEMVHATPEFELFIKRAIAFHDFAECIKDFLDGSNDEILHKIKDSINKQESITEYIRSMEMVYPGYENDPLTEFVKFCTSDAIENECTPSFATAISKMYSMTEKEILFKYGIRFDEETHNLFMRASIKAELVMFGSIRIDLNDVYYTAPSATINGVVIGIEKYLKPYVLWYYRHEILRRFSELGYVFNVIDPLQFDIILPEPEMDDEMPNIDDDFGDESDSEDVDDMDFDPVEEFDD